LDTTSQFSQILNDSGFIKCVRLSDDDIAGTRDEKGVVEKYLTLDTGENTTLSDIDFRDSEMRVGDKYCKMYTLADADDMPSMVGPRIRYEPFSTDKTSFSLGYASHLGLLLDCNHIYSQYLYLVDADEKKKELESSRNNLAALAKYSRANAINAEKKANFLNIMQSTGQRPVRIHFNILTWNENKSALKVDGNKVAGAITKIGGTPRVETTSIATLYWTGIPGAGADLPEELTFDEFMEAGTSLWNVETNYRDSLSPVGVKLTDRLNGRPVHVDFSDEPKDRNYISNRNKFIVGGSGSGKSFFTNHMLRHYAEQDTDIVIVDIGHSYKGLCDMMGGYYFTYSEENYIKFNPFITHDGKKPDTEKAESLKSLIISLYGKDWNPDGGSSGINSLTKGEYMAISSSISGYYLHLEENKDIRPSFNTFYEYLDNEFRSQMEKDGVREKDFDLTNLLFVLKSFYKGGEYDYLLNSEENLDLHDQKFIVFEIDAIKDNPVLFPVVTIILMEVFISKMRKKKGVRKVMLIEEAWKAIARSGMAEFIKYLYKTCRKFFGETWIVTQEIEDMLESPIIKKAIINNADTKIVLDLSKFMNKFDNISALMGLSEHEANQILSLNRHEAKDRKYKEVFVSFNGVYSNIYCVEVSKEEYLTFTTEEKEKQAVEQAAERLGNYEQAVLEVSRGLK
jgi:conjugation system TraG family ATPase